MAMSQVSERQNVTELAELYDLEQLRQLKYRYLRHLDLKEWDQLERLFTPDATATYADGAYACNSRDQIIEFLREVLGPAMVTMHQCHHPELKVRGNRAIGRWYLQDTVHMMEHRLTLEGSAFYEDRYLRTEGGWRIAHTGYRRVVDRTIAWDDLPGMKISAPGFESQG
jgi:hypothetical protein